MFDFLVTLLERYLFITGVPELAETFENAFSFFHQESPDSGNTDFLIRVKKKSKSFYLFCLLHGIDLKLIIKLFTELLYSQEVLYFAASHFYKFTSVKEMKKTIAFQIKDRKKPVDVAIFYQNGKSK